MWSSIYKLRYSRKYILLNMLFVCILVSTETKKWIVFLIISIYGSILIILLAREHWDKIKEVISGWIPEEDVDCIYTSARGGVMRWPFFIYVVLKIWRWHFALVMLDFICCWLFCCAHELVALKFVRYSGGWIHWLTVGSTWTISQVGGNVGFFDVKLKG